MSEESPACARSGGARVASAAGVVARIGDPVALPGRGVAIARGGGAFEAMQLPTHGDAVARLAGGRGRRLVTRAEPGGVFAVGGGLVRIGGGLVRVGRALIRIG